MTTLQAAVDGFNRLVELVEDSAPGLKPERHDWSSARDALDEVERAAHEALRLWKEIEDSEERRGLGEAAAWSLGRTGALLRNAGRGSGPDLIRTASNMDPDDPALRFGRSDPDGFVRLMHALAVRAGGDKRASDRLLSALEAERPDPDLQEALRNMRSAGEPITSAPALFTLNGFGTGIYGHRDEHPDGSYVATYCICLLFVPVIPLSAYRVFNHGDGQYSFMAKVGLSGFARTFRLALAAIALMAVGYGVFQSTWNSPEQRVGRAYAAAEASAEGRPPAEAVEVWRGYLEHEDVSVRPDLAKQAAGSLVAARVAQVPEPFSAAHLADVERIVAEYRSAPREWRSEDTTAGLVTAVQGWAKALEDPRRRLALLRIGRRLLPARPSTRLQALQREVVTQMAELMTEAQPLEAIATYAGVLDLAPARAKSAALVTEASRRWALVREERELLQAWAAAAGPHPDTEPARKALAAALEQAEARTADEKRTKALESAKPRALTKIVEADMGDVDAAMRLAGYHASKGALDRAEQVLLRVGPGPWLTSAAQTMLARIWMGLGRSQDAERLLEDQVARRLPRLTAAREAYSARIDSLQRTLEGEAQRGKGPPALESAFKAEDQARIQEAFGAWMRERMQTDARLQDLRTRYQEASSVVDAAVDLGGLKLERANAATGEAREALLTEAEQVFLSVGQESEGMPDYHHGLGTIYYRLEKREKGDAEFAKVLALNDPTWDIRVASAYRSLGLEDKTRALCQELYDESTGPMRDAAARMLALTAKTFEDEQRWLAAVVDKGLGDKANLAQVQAVLALRKGDTAAAAGHYDTSYRLWSKLGNDDSAAVNNRALALQNKFGCTGRLAELDVVVQDLATASALAPDSAIGVSNYSSVLMYRAALRTLTQWVKVEEFPLEQSDTLSILYALEHGPEREKVLELLSSPDVQRARELARRARTLAPARVGGYGSEVFFADLEDDADKLEGLLAAARHSLPLDRPHVPTPLADSREAVQAALPIARHWVKRARHPPTKAAALLSLARLVEAEADLSADPAKYAQARDLAAQAQKLWPSLDLRSGQRRLHLAEAMAEALASDEAVKARFLEERWGGAIAIFALVLKKEGGHDALLERLTGHSHFAAAVKLARSFGPDRPGLQGWAIGALTGDDALVANNQGLFTDPVHTRVQALRAHLSTSVPTRAAWRIYSAARP